MSDTGLFTVSLETCCLSTTGPVSPFKVESPCFQTTDTPFDRTFDVVQVMVALVPTLTSAGVVLQQVTVYGFIGTMCA